MSLVVILLKTWPLRLRPCYPNLAKYQEENACQLVFLPLWVWSVLFIQREVSLSERNSKCLNCSSWGTYSFNLQTQFSGLIFHVHIQNGSSFTDTAEDGYTAKEVRAGFNEQRTKFVNHTMELNGGMVVTTLSTNNQREKENVGKYHWGHPI